MDLSKLTARELKDVAREQGLVGWSKLRKKELISFIAKFLFEEEREIKGVAESILLFELPVIKLGLPVIKLEVPTSLPPIAPETSIPSNIITIEDPEEFFYLLPEDQERMLLGMDWDSIQTLCKAASFSEEYHSQILLENPERVAVFEGLCNDPDFWKAKFKQDFGEEVFEMFSGKADLLKRDWDPEFWKEEYAILDGDIPLPGLVPAKIETRQIEDTDKIEDTEDIDDFEDTEDSDDDDFEIILDISEGSSQVNLYSDLQRAQFPDLLELCESSPESQEICSQDDFWQNKLIRDLGKKYPTGGMSELPLHKGTWREEYEYYFRQLQNDLTNRIKTRDYKNIQELFNFGLRKDLAEESIRSEIFSGVLKDPTENIVDREEYFSVNEAGRALYFDPVPGLWNRINSIENTYARGSDPPTILIYGTYTPSDTKFVALVSDKVYVEPSLNLKTKLGSNVLYYLNGSKTPEFANISGAQYFFEESTLNDRVFHVFTTSLPKEGKEEIGTHEMTVRGVRLPQEGVVLPSLRKDVEILI